MKRIADFEDCRMDMKNMAALNGGVSCTTSRVDTTDPFGCDIGIYRNYDDSFTINGHVTKYSYWTYEEKRVDCKEESTMFTDISTIPKEVINVFKPVAI